MATPKKDQDSQAEREYRQMLDAGGKAAKAVQGWAQPVKAERRTGEHLPVDQQRAE